MVNNKSKLDTFFDYWSNLKKQAGSIPNPHLRALASGAIIISALFISISSISIAVGIPILFFGLLLYIRKFNPILAMIIFALSTCYILGKFFPNKNSGLNKKEVNKNGKQEIRQSRNKK